MARWAASKLGGGGDDYGGEGDGDGDGDDEDDYGGGQLASWVVEM